ncbi:MAG: homoserine kinase [Hyphomicrobiales bacterium]|nr:homoserine kinase [Hyphomicrobiales bacterium]
MAVYTEVSDEELSAYLARYDLGELLACKGIAEGVENSNFLLHTDAGFFILTLYEKRVDTRDLPFFLGLMEHLSERGVTCPQPVHARDGSALGTLAGRPAVIVTFLDGLSIKHPSPRQCGMLGEAMAQLHIAAGDFTIRRANAMGMEAWITLFEQARMQADTVRPGLTSLIEAELSFLKSNWPADLPAGVIHADLFPDNVFFRSGHLSGLIDFYFACNDFLAYDLVISMNAWCFEQDGSFNVTAAMAMLNSYCQTRPLTPAEVQSLPVLARGAALRFLLTRLVDWLNVPEGALVKPKNPLEYVRKLRFHQQVNGAGEYGLQT